MITSLKERISNLRLVYRRDHSLSLWLHGYSWKVLVWWDLCLFLTYKTKFNHASLLLRPLTSILHCSRECCPAASSAIPFTNFSFVPYAHPSYSGSDFLNHCLKPPTFVLSILPKQPLPHRYSVLKVTANVPLA